MDNSVPNRIPIIYVREEEEKELRRMRSKHADIPFSELWTTLRYSTCYPSDQLSFNQILKLYFYNTDNTFTKAIRYIADIYGVHPHIVGIALFGIFFIFILNTFSITGIIFCFGMFLYPSYQTYRLLQNKNISRNDLIKLAK